ncbi:MAG: ParA family protein [Desulfobacteraceae bacterium]|nr:ParA family protein [Desulfobacteraceae bacterium]
MPKKIQVVSITNQKGGCGKTTTAVNLSAALARLGQKVLVIDMDPQGNTTKVLGDPSMLPQWRTIVDFFDDEEATLESCINSTKYKEIDAIYSHLDLFSTKIRLISEPLNYVKLRSYLSKELRKKYNYIIIDTPPDLGGILMTNALSASDGYIVPVGTEDAFALQGVKQIATFIKSIRKGLNPTLEMIGVLITMRDDRSNITKAMLQAIPNAFGQEHIFKTCIKRNVAISAASAKNMTIFKYDAKQQGAKDYLNFAKEFIEKTNG